LASKRRTTELDPVPVARPSRRELMTKEPQRAGPRGESLTRRTKRACDRKTMTKKAKRRRVMPREQRSAESARVGKEGSR